MMDVVSGIGGTDGAPLVSKSPQHDATDADGEDDVAVGDDDDVTARVGALHVAHAPGLKSTFTGTCRDLDADLGRLSEVYGTTTIVSLLPRTEAQRLTIGPRIEAEAAAAVGMKLLRFPIVNGGIPDDMAVFSDFVDALVARMLAGERLLVHCRAGYGRAGMVAVAMLLRSGACTSLAAAIAHARRKRPSSRTRMVENERQEAFLADYATAAGLLLE
ncbi:dual specificity protein phosphatase [Thecamonas trahens ATCC 50062]|uniref:Dual specificity protein phosphatase n=1 Tax=Thecamonas trahens ATCC 50062 TaxID=461836 RepID=A0A0L0D1V5_THETB|nr:dual specificity protein phosphatase [Thecamonas trahens ATCC 50062]KNC46339.1 dual specificity protein phosphatase [Thecamonas trahens ATCC 50062]|eukprot:XP_013760632.1 dual specificity protein phosphatase [Thecamonas trahens ATCC 50062]